MKTSLKPARIGSPNRALASPASTSLYLSTKKEEKRDEKQK